VIFPKKILESSFGYVPRTHLFFARYPQKDVSIISSFGKYPAKKAFEKRILEMILPNKNLFFWWDVPCKVP